MKLSLRYSLLVAAILGSAAGCTATLSSTKEVVIHYDAMKELVRAGSALQNTVTRQEESHHFFREKLDKEYIDLMLKIRAVREWAEKVAGADVVARCAAGEVNEVQTTVKNVEEGSPTVEVEIIVPETAKEEPVKKSGCFKPKEGRKEESTDEDFCNRDLTTEEAEVVNEDSKAKDGDKEIKDAKADHVHSASDDPDAKESTSESDEPKECYEPSAEKNEGCYGTGAPKDNAETREDEKNHTDKVHEGSDGKDDLKGDGEVKETKTDDDVTEKNSTDEPAGKNNSAEEKSNKTKNNEESVAEKDDHEEKSDKTKKKEKKKGKSRQSDDSEDEAADKKDLVADITNEEDASKKPTEDASKKLTEDAEKEKVAPVIKSETGESALKQELEAESLDNIVADQESMASFNKPTTMSMIVGILSLGSVAVLY